MSKVYMPTPSWARDHHGETEVYTGEDLEAYAAAVRREALEEAARVAGERSTYLPHYPDITRGYAQGRADAEHDIRALIEREKV
jgi:LmbE family N-acetylglucosaminyl deacetylase